MCALRKMRIFMGAVLLSPCLVMADGGEPAAPKMPPPAPMAPAMSPPMVWQAPMWVQMVPVSGNQPYYPMPQPGMGWPVLPHYAAPMFIPPVTSAPWPPFMWVIVPVQAMSHSPAGIDYGPVADTPVIELPPPDEAPAAPTPEGSMSAPTAVEMDRPVSGQGRMTDPSSNMNEPSVVGATEPAAAPAAVSAVALMVDYGPVTPTPVVDLLALQKQTAVESVPKPSTSNPARKASATPSSKPRSTATTKPVKKRMCWTNGVVAPCR